MLLFLEIVVGLLFLANFITDVLILVNVKHALN